MDTTLPLYTPDLLGILTETVAFDVPKVPGITNKAKKGIKKMEIPDYRGRARRQHRGSYPTGRKLFGHGLQGTQGPV